MVCDSWLVKSTSSKSPRSILFSHSSTSPRVVLREDLTGCNDTHVTFSPMFNAQITTKPSHPKSKISNTFSGRDRQDRACGPSSHRGGDASSAEKCVVVGLSGGLGSSLRRPTCLKHVQNCIHIIDVTLMVYTFARCWHIEAYRLCAGRLRRATCPSNSVAGPRIVNAGVGGQAGVQQTRRFQFTFLSCSHIYIYIYCIHLVNDATPPSWLTLMANTDRGLCSPQPCSRACMKGLTFGLCVCVL